MACINSVEGFAHHAVFYGTQLLLVGFAAIIIYNDLDPRISARQEQMDTNIVGDNPGLSFRPMIYEKDGTPQSLLSYRHSDRSGYRELTQSLDKFLDVYRRHGLVPGRSGGIANCNFQYPPGPGQVCDVDIQHWSPCIPENYYNYHRDAPCIFIRPNMPPGWMPAYYNDTNSLPLDMPEQLKTCIQDLARKDISQLNTVWVSCEGENPADVENIGRINYIPRCGFPGYYFMNRNSEGYLAPLVAIHFERPMIGVLISIKCKAWARNIKHDNDTALGGVQFQMMIRPE